MRPEPVSNEIMLTTEAKDCKNISQDYYDSLVNSLQIHIIRCPSCHHAGNMVIHGYYHRWAKSFQNTFRLRIRRLKCRECGKTHAILPSSLVPYCQVSTDAQIQIARKVEEETPPDVLIAPESDIDENNVKSVVRKYRRHTLPTVGRVRDFHPLETCAIGRTKLRALKHLVSRLF